jgi:hypothetical protein
MREFRVNFTNARFLNVRLIARTFSQYKSCWQSPGTFKLCPDYENRHWMQLIQVRAFRLRASHPVTSKTGNHGGCRNPDRMTGVLNLSGVDCAGPPAPAPPGDRRRSSPRPAPTLPPGRRLTTGPRKSPINALITGRFPEFIQPNIEWHLQRTFGEHGAAAAEGDARIPCGFSKRAFSEHVRLRESDFHTRHTGIRPLGTTPAARPPGDGRIPQGLRAWRRPGTTRSGKKSDQRIDSKALSRIYTTKN